MFSWQNFLVGLGNQVENFERRSVIFGDAVSQRVLKTKLIILERDFLLLNFQDQEKNFLDQALCLTFIFWTCHWLNRYFVEWKQSLSACRIILMSM